jgi:hypothetical protein
MNTSLVDELYEETLYADSKQCDAFILQCQHRGDWFRRDSNDVICKFVKVDTANDNYKWQYVYRNIYDDVMQNGQWRNIYKEEITTTPRKYIYKYRLWCRAHNKNCTHC